VELTGVQTIDLPREQVWKALNDPDVLRQCIPGCDTFDPVGENEYQIAMTASVGPVKARFKGKLLLSDITPPTSYALSFEGSGGAAGFGKGNANVELADTASGGTELRYSVQAKVGGKLAQVGARLIDGVAKKMADEFFSRFKAVISADQAQSPASGTDAPSTTASAPAHSAPVSGQASSGGMRWVWVAGAAIVAAVIIASVA